ncbi:MAG TPA: hypothetical protein VF746_10755 [Longimicrobium sp.]|jgi:hypothetical protein
MPRKAHSISRVQTEDLEQDERARPSGPESGLASVAGGWEDSKELVDILDSSSRTGSRQAEGLD